MYNLDKNIIGRRTMFNLSSSSIQVANWEKFRSFIWEKKILFRIGNGFKSSRSRALWSLNI